MKNLFEYTSVPWIRYSSYECNFHALLVMVQMCFSFMLMNKGRDMHMCKHLSQAGRGMNFTARNVRTGLMSANQEQRKRGEKISP